MAKIEIDKKKRYERQSDIFCGKELCVGIVGVGAVGRQIAVQLSAMGVEKLVIIDYDTVEDVNLCAQGFREKDMGKSKVKAVASAAWEANSGTKITQYEEVYHQEMLSDCQYVFCSVDNMATRKQLSEEVKVPMFDSRMAARVCAIKTITDKASFDYYTDELFTDEEMVEETCTAKTTLFCANICAGLMIAQMVTVWRGEPVKHDICFDISAMTFFVRRPDKPKPTLKDVEIKADIAEGQVMRWEHVTTNTNLTTPTVADYITFDETKGD
jgi:sulfur carrier protein ThiS adenylyltransferase